MLHPIIFAPAIYENVRSHFLSPSSLQPLAFSFQPLAFSFQPLAYCFQLFSL